MGKKYNTESFVKRLKEIYGDKYDYSKTIFTNYDSNVIVICKIHGEFEIKPHSLISQVGDCSKCNMGILTNELFIKKSIEKHGNKYDYSEVNYIDNKQKVKIKCLEHGYFEISPSNHLKGLTCIRCVNKFIGKKMTTEEFIIRANYIHNNEFNYDNVKYVNTNTKVIITCKTHGDFEMQPNNHLNGQKCSKCSNNNFRYTTETFIIKAKEKHDNKYDYSLVEYVKGSKKIKIICKEHGLFEQEATSHLQGSGCDKCSIKNCADKQRSTLVDFIKKANEKHNNYYDYSKVSYVGCFVNVKIICPVHGEFEQKPSKHLCGHGCTECNRKKRNDKFTMSQEDFIKKANEKHLNKYDYSKTEYKNYGISIIIKCKIHGEFNQSPRSHLIGHGCPCCYNKTEGNVYKEIRKYYPELIFQYRANWCKQNKFLPFDMALEKEKIIIEVDGGQHFRQVRNWRSPEEQQNIDVYKMKCALKNGFSIIRITQEDIYNETIDWQNELLEAIEDNIKEKITNITFICKNNEYSVFDKLI
jgi:very-short-patch-repair endonuclease